MEDQSRLDEDGFLRPLDWIVIGILLAASALIGVYYRFTGGKQKTAEEYFTADRSTGPVLLAITLMVSFLSGTSILGNCGETYSYGTQFNIGYFALFTGSVIAGYFYLPVFYELKTISIFEYLEKRFGPTARRLASITNFMQFSVFTGIIIYTPSLALEATTGLNGYLSTVLVGFFCTFYSTVGGLKAVIITDLLQAALMFACVIAVIAVGLADLDSDFWSVIEIADTGDRLNFFKIEFDPTIRHTWLSLSLGGTCYFVAYYAVNQAQVQRMLASRTLKEARKAILLHVPMTIALSSLTAFCGLVLYAYYNKCDPVSAGKIKSYDMVMPYFSKERMTRFPGLAGVFVAGIFSASLSTVSAQLNSLSAIALTDYLRPLCQKYGHEIPDDKAAFYGKLTALAIGTFSLGVAFLASILGQLFQIMISVNGAVFGPILGLFTLGMFFECANETGALIGTGVALVLNVFLVFSPKRRAPFLPMSIEGCYNTTIITPKLSKMVDNSTWLSRLSYLWYTPIGASMTVIIGVIASIIINKLSKTPRPDLEPNLFTPFVAARIKRRLN